MKKIFLTIIVILGIQGVVMHAQTNADTEDKKDIRFNISKDGSRYVKLAITNQVWVRFNESNPGTIVNSTQKPYTFDIGIRRLRFQIIGQIHDKFFIYVQFGMNNFNAFAPRKMGDFFHDAIVEYTPLKHKVAQISLGAGLTGWTGHSRFSSPGVATFLGIDAPIYQQGTNDVSDQFIRKLSVYVKGKIWKFDYRFVLSDPFTVTSSNLFDPNITQYANFTGLGRSIQPSGYVSFQAFDQESNQIPYAVGTYHGTKRVLNVGGGFQYQKDATWYLTNGTDTNFHDMLLIGADVFYDTYLGKNKDWAFSLYAAYNYYNFGPGYLRELGVMNPGQSVAPGTATVNGTGSAFPMIGTGHTGYVQTGVMFPKKWFGSKNFTMMPYVSTQISKWDRLNDAMVMFEGGMNFLFDSHKYKMTLGYQNRPVFDNVNLRQTTRNSMLTFQFQISI